MGSKDAVLNIAINLGRIARFLETKKLSRATKKTVGIQILPKISIPLPVFLHTALSSSIQRFSC